LVKNNYYLIDSFVAHNNTEKEWLTSHKK